MTDYAEKRDFQRMALDCSMQFSLAESEQKFDAKVINLSAKGILFIATDELATGTPVEIKLTPVSNITPPMSANTIVARCEKKGDNEFHVAAEIVQIL